MQYFKPSDPFFVGDCMPFFHQGEFHLYYLLDENHHQSLGGLGGHQWAHASSTDLVNWDHHPLAIPITHDWEGSICTGSVFHHQGTYYGYYATRMPDWKQHLSLATSTDGIKFEKVQPNPLASPIQGYDPHHYRDPVVFCDGGVFHMLVTAKLTNYPIEDRGGCLAHLMSNDLQNWEVVDPFFVPGELTVPECPDYFEWSGWYYLIFSTFGVAHYRVSKNPFGPWETPAIDTFDGPVARVLKTAEFSGNRRLGVAFLGTRQDNKDDGRLQYAGHAVFREIIQYPDGSLGTRFPLEMIPKTGEMLDLPFRPLTSATFKQEDRIYLAARQGLEVGMLTDVPENVRITMQIVPKSNSESFGLRLKGSGNFESGYLLRLSPYERSVDLNGQSILNVEGLDHSCRLEVVLRDDIIDVCVDDRRCLVNRCPGLSGNRLFFFCRNGQVIFQDLQVSPLSSN